MLVQRLAREVGVTEREASWALNIENNIRDARRLLEEEQQRRLQRAGKALSALWDRYVSPTDSSVSDIEGSLRLVEDCGLDPEEASVLAMIYEFQAPELGIFSRIGFLCGVDRLKIRDVQSLRDTVQYLKQLFENDSAYFASVYGYCFSYIAAGKGISGNTVRSLPVDTALSYWHLLLVPQFPLARDWCEFMHERQSCVSRDTWLMILQFLTSARQDESLSFYDESGSWPPVIDEFVEWLVNPEDRGAGAK